MSLLKVCQIFFISLLVVSCGGSSGSDLAEAIAAELRTGEGEQPVIDGQSADCIANGVVEGIGQERLEEIGFTPEDVSAMDSGDYTFREIRIINESFEECVDLSGYDPFDSIEPVELPSIIDQSYQTNF